MGTNDKYRIFLIFLDFIFIDLLVWYQKCQEKRQERTVSKLAIQKAHHFKAAWIIFERPGDAMSYFSTEEVDNLKSLRAMVTEDLINETDYEDAKGTILAVAKKRRLFSRSRLMTCATSTKSSQVKFLLSTQIQNSPL